MGISSKMNLLSKAYDVSCIIRHFSILIASLLMIAACYAESGTPVAENTGQEYMVLGLVGYNYSDRHISDYSVNGAGGGIINKSSPTSGGSGVSCCVRLSKTYTGPIRVKVRWQVDGCTYLIKDDRTGKADKVRHFYYREAEIDVQRAQGNDPNYIETHFYPGGKVLAALTENISKPALSLDPKRPDRSYFPRCKDDKEPDD